MLLSFRNRSERNIAKQCFIEAAFDQSFLGFSASLWFVVP